MMNGTIPESIGRLTNLYFLDLLENHWEGTMTNIHFHNLTNLFSLSVSCHLNKTHFLWKWNWLGSNF